MDINGIRLTNYNRLLREFAAREDQSDLPRHGLLTRFSTVVDVSPRYLSHVNNGRKNIGGALARKLEQAFNYPSGWMDNLDDEVALPPTDPESDFVATALRLYREAPTEVQGLLMRYMADKIEKQKGVSNASSKSSGGGK